MLSLGSFRLTRLVVFDEITSFIRSPFHEEIEEMDEDGTTSTYIKIKGSGIRGWFGELLSCHWCTGVWSALLLYTLWMYWPLVGQPLVLVLAIAGCAAIIETIISKLTT
ncbi:DUF1360 domain-containing protein [Bacillus salitolerans]|uniref:DUF1360 domain-containing protein n=1 Tax=Bacillus salitolerans TaxID=1437434 RepID=A0ABW4LKX4_9BACI